jgi:hypothetical protein
VLPLSTPSACSLVLARQMFVCSRLDISRHRCVLTWHFADIPQISQCHTLKSKLIVATAHSSRTGRTNLSRSVHVESIDDLNSGKLGIYVEHFPNPRAGAPISDQVLPALDLEEYLQATGPFTNLENFDVAQILMSSEMTNGLRNWYLDT